MSPGLLGLVSLALENARENSTAIPPWIRSRGPCGRLPGPSAAVEESEVVLGRCCLLAANTSATERSSRAVNAFDPPGPLLMRGGGLCLEPRWAACETAVVPRQALQTYSWNRTQLYYSHIALV